MSLKQKTIQSLFWSAIQNWGSQAGSLIVFLVLARLLTPEAFGLVALANVFIAFMQIFLDQGFVAALIQREEIEPEHLDTVFWTQIVSSIVLISIALMTAGWVAVWFRQPQLIPLIQSLSILFFLSALSCVQRAILKREFAYQSLALRTLFGILSGGLVGVFMALMGWGVWSLVGQQLIYESVSTIFLWRASEWRPTLRFSTQHFWQLHNFSIHMMAFQLVSFFNTRTDNLLIGYYFGETVLGYYAIAHRILQVMVQLLAGTINQVALSTFSRLQIDLPLFRQVFYQVTQFTSLIAFPTFLGVAILAPELVVVLFGQKWQPSIPVLQILTLAGMLRSLSVFNESVLTALGKPNWRFQIGLFNGILNVTACLVAVRWGMVAVSIAYVVSDYLAFPASLWAINKLIKVQFFSYLKQFSIAISSASIMGAIIMLTRHFLKAFTHELILLAISTTVGVIVYGLAVQLLAPEIAHKFISLVSSVNLKSRKI